MSNESRELTKELSQNKVTFALDSVTGVGMYLASGISRDQILGDRDE